MGKSRIVVVPHLPYSPDLIPYIFLFPEMKLKLEEGQKKLQQIFITEQEFQTCFQQ
jgi:hypothetical protein